uniref:Odorant receptor n=1 Tax=Anopheles farauti TaxID=69004 RepID=A0A182QK86_9DIPT
MDGLVGSVGKQVAPNSQALMEGKNGNRDSLDQFRTTVDRQNRILALFGCYMYTDRHRFSYRIVLICFIAISFIVLSVYSAVQTWGDMGQVVLSIVAVFYAIVGVARLAVAISNPAGCYRSLRLAEETYRHANGAHAGEQGVLAKYTALFCNSVTLYTYSFLVGVFIVALMPFGCYLVLGERFLPLGIAIPFTDGETVNGFWCTLAVQLVYILFGPLALIPSQNIYFALIFNICLQYELLIERLKQLDNMIRCDGASAGNTPTKGCAVRDQLVRIIQIQQRSTNYITHIESLYHLQTFVEFLCNSLQVALTLNVLHRSFWLPGFFVLPVAIVQMLILCSLGTLIELKSDQFTNHLYGIAWSEMDLPLQAMFKFVLNNAQKPTRLTCGRFAVINMNLFMAYYEMSYGLNVEMHKQNHVASVVALSCKIAKHRGRE